MTNRYDFDGLLVRFAELADLNEIFNLANKECKSASDASGGRGGPRERALGSNKYAHRIKEFLNYLYQCIDSAEPQKPGSASAEDFAKYRPILEGLTQKDQLPKTALKPFESKKPRTG